MSRKEPKRRPDGRMQRQVTVKNVVTGEKIVQTIYGYSVAELTSKEQITRDLYSKVVYNKLTLYKYLSQYIADRKSELDGVDGLNTLELYERHFNIYIKDTPLGNTELTDLNVFNLRKFFTDFTSKNPAYTGKSTKQHLYTELKTALHRASMDGLIQFNPLDKVNKPKCKSREKSVVTDAQFKEIMTRARKSSPQIANMFILDLQSGMRRSELVALRFTDIDFKRGIITVNKSLKRTKQYGVVQGSTKNFTSARKLLLDKISLITLKDQLSLAKSLYAEKDKPFSLNAFVFESLPGRHYSLDWITKSFASQRDALGYPRTMTLHSLRHTAATFLAENDVSTRKLMARFGWSTGKMADRYTHETEKMQEDIVNILNAAEISKSVKKSVSE